MKLLLQSISWVFTLSQPFPKQQILDSTKLKEFANKNLRFDENVRRLPRWVENTWGKRRNYLLQAISSFLTVFSKDLYFRNVKSRAVLERVKVIMYKLHFVNFMQFCFASRWRA